MGLLQYDDVGNVSFTKDLPESKLSKYRYAVLSHTWGPDEEEVTYDDVVSGIGLSKPGTGSEKIRFCIEQTRRDGLDYCWVDTCCIDKRNLVELSRALISMFRWFSNAEKCYVFLSDVLYTNLKLGEEQGRKNCRHNLGTKASLGEIISEITHIPMGALHGQPLASFTIEERLSWQESRQTKEEEDMVYSLLGIFNISMPVLYGEGKAQAYARLGALLKQPEMSPRPSSNVPFRRDPHFVERVGLADQIRSKLAVPAGRAVLVGLGGIGATRFEQSVRDVVNHLRLFGRDDSKVDHLQLLQNWLRDESKGRWLLVLDNADDAGFLVEPPEMASNEQLRQRRLDYIPSCDHGSVIVTTRSKSEALKLAYEAEIVNVLPMAADEAEALLVSKLGYPSLDNRRLVASLDCMPLAIAQAGAYIRERGSRCSVQQYCVDIEQSHWSRSSILRRCVPLPDRDAVAINSVMLTWQISFNHIYETQRSAAELLSLMSFCDRLAIPETFLRVEDDVGSPSSSPTFEEDIVALRNFSFITETVGSPSWEMHRLVQDATQVWLQDCGRLEEVRVLFVDRLHRSAPDGRFENWPQWRILFPHVVSALEQRPADSDAQLTWALVMYYGASYAQAQGAFDSALVMAKVSKTVFSERLGVDDEATLLSIATVASIYQNQGRWEEAEQLEVKLVETAREKLGPDHLLTLTGMANLAATYWNQGRWGEAEQLDVKVIETSREMLGADHLETLSGIGNLVSTYRQQGRWEEAEKLEVKVMETRIERLGLDHLLTLAGMSNLASTYRQQGRCEEVEQLEVKVIERKRKKLGCDHPDTLAAIANLTSTYRDQGRLEEAEQLDMNAMERRRQKLGLIHPDTLISMANLASTYQQQGRWSEAEQLYVKVKESRREKLGADHPETLTSMAGLASTYSHQGRMDEAEQLQVKVMQTRREKLGPIHPHTLNSMASLAGTYYSQGRWEEAEQLATNVIGPRREKLGADHPDTIDSMNDLAAIYSGQRRWAEAEHLQMQAVEGYRKSGGLQHPRALIAVSNLAAIQAYRRQHSANVLSRERSPQSNMQMSERRSNSSDDVPEQASHNHRWQWLKKLRDMVHRT
nr:vegetative incompatibility protein het-e-1 [Quercus suber]